MAEEQTKPAEGSLRRTLAVSRVDRAETAIVELQAERELLDQEFHERAASLDERWRAAVGEKHAAKQALAELDQPAMQEPPPPIPEEMLKVGDTPA